MRGVVAAALVALLATPAARASDGPAPTFYGAKGPVALPADGDGQTAFRMPAGIGWSLDSSIDLDLFFAYFHSTAKNALNDVDKGGVGGGLSFGAVIVPDDGGPFTLHVGIYPDQGALSPKRTKVRYTTFPETIALRADTMFVTAAVSLVAAPTSWLSIGASVHVIPAVMKSRLLLGGGGQRLELAGSPAINGVPLPGDPTYADFLDLFGASGPSDPTLIYEADAFSLQLSGVLSVSVKPTPDLAIGLAWRPRSYAAIPFHGEARIDAAATFQQALGTIDPAVRSLFLATLPDGGSRGFTAKYDLEQDGPYVPQSLRGSVAWWPTDRLLVAAEVAWVEWHRAFGTTKVRLSHGSNRDFNFVVGSDKIGVSAPTRWRNQWTVSASTAWLATETLTLRGGFHLGESPLNPRIVGSISTPSFASTSVMGGAGLQVTPDVQVNALLEWVFTERTRSGAGTGSMTTENTKYTADQVVLHLGLTCWF